MASVTLNSLILANGFDLSGYLTSIDVESSVDMLDNTVLSQTSNARTYQPGLKEHSIKGESFFAYDSTTDANSIDRTFSEALGVGNDRRFLIAPAGFSAVGDLCYICNTKQAQYSIKETVGELIKLDFEAKAGGDNSATTTFSPAIFLMRTSATTTGAGTSVDNATTSAGYMAQCHVTEQVSLSGATVKVQHSTDNSTWADLCTFANFTANGSDQKFGTTTVNRYRRANVTTFSGTSARVTVALKSPYSV